MGLRLQLFGHRESSYERPTQEWCCGHAESGSPCRPGPDANGRCRAEAECTPQIRDGRWCCTRPAAAGGPCDEGPLPDGGCGIYRKRFGPDAYWRQVTQLVGTWQATGTVPAPGSSDVDTGTRPLRRIEFHKDRSVTITLPDRSHSVPP